MTMTEFFHHLVCVACGKRIGPFLETCDALVSFTEKLHFPFHQSCLKRR
jgi:hypothetical protein